MRVRRTIRGVCLGIALVCAAWQSTGGASAQSGPSPAQLLPPEIRTAGKIVAGSEISSPPIIYFDADGRTMKGLDIDLAAAMAKVLGVTIEFQNIAFAGLTPAMQAHKIDIIFNVIADTREREQVLDFVDYANTGSSLLIQKGNPHDIHSLADVCGSTLATIRGATQIALAQTQSDRCTAAGKPAITISLYDSPADGRLQVQTGKVACFFGNPPTLTYLAQTAGGGTIFEVVPEVYDPQPIGIAVRKDDTKLRDALQAALKALVADGTYAKLLAANHLESSALPSIPLNGAPN